MDTHPPQGMKHCWKRIGAWGNEKPRCPKLEHVIHCYNCDVFTQTGRHLLDRDLPDGYSHEWAEVMAAKKEEEPFSTISVIIFRVENEWLALRTRVLSEVIAPDRPLIHSLPHRRSPVLLGVINVRGEIQLCVSLRELLGMEDGGGDKSTHKRYRRMLVIKDENDKWVFPVNEIFGIYRIQPSLFENVPVTVAKSQSTFTKGIFKWQDRHVAFLDDDLMFFSLNRGVQ